MLDVHWGNVKHGTLYTQNEAIVTAARSFTVIKIINYMARLKAAYKGNKKPKQAQMKLASFERQAEAAYNIKLVEGIDNSER